MSRSVYRLSTTKIARITTPGYHPDGAGLYLQVSAAGTQSWILRFRQNGRVRDMGLGSAAQVSLAKARRRAADARAILADGRDPIDIRESKRTAARLDGAVVTFSAAAEAYVQAHEPSWRNKKHRAQWRSTLAQYASLKLGHLPVATIDTDHVLVVLQPVWHRIPETASRLRGRIECVLDWAKARGLRSGENPARWRGHLDNLLPKPSKLGPVRHHPALPFVALPSFMRRLRARTGPAARALEFLILTGARTGEVLRCRRDEFDLKTALWTIPAERMKAGREHRVPLGSRACAIAKAAMQEDDGFVFRNGRGQPFSDMALLMLVRDLVPGVTSHGFRSTFRDWVSERTDYPREVAECALAHAIGNDVEAAYRRGDLLDKRRRLMRDWERYCSDVKGTK